MSEPQEENPKSDSTESSIHLSEVREVGKLSSSGLDNLAFNAIQFERMKAKREMGLDR